MGKLAQFVVKRPRVVLLLLGVVTIGFAAFLPGIQLKTDTKSLAPENDPVIKQLEEAIEEFGSQEVMMVVLKGDIFTPEALSKIDRLSRAISRLHGVESATSPLDVQLVRGYDLGIEIRPVAEAVPRTPEEVEAFRRNLMSTEQGPAMVTGDGRAGAIFITLEPDIIATRRAEILAQELEELASREKGPEEIYVVGEAYMAYWASRNMRGDLRFLFPLTLLSIVTALYLSFRNPLDVAVLILAVLMSIIWTLGLMAAFGYDITMVSMILPVILIAMGSAAGIHILNRFHEEVNSGREPWEALLAIYKELTSPILMTALTTAAGFGSLITSFVQPVKEFGVFSAVGIMFSMVISLTCIPAFLVIRASRAERLAKAAPSSGGRSPRGVPEGRRDSSRGRASILQRVLDNLAGYAALRPWVVVTCAILVLVAFAVGIPRLSIETNIMQYFRKDSPVVKGTEIVEEDFGGTLRLSVLVDTGREDGIKEPWVLNRMLKLEEDMNSMDDVSGAASIADLIRQVNRALHGDSQEHYVIPESPDAVAQELLLFTMQGGTGLDSMVSYDFRKALITARVANVPTGELKGIIDSVEKRVEAAFGDSGIKATVVGLPKVVLRLMDRFMDSQLKSLFWSMLGCWVVVTIVMGSLLLGSLCLIPLVLTVVINFGFMAYLGIPLDVVTMMISGICIGIGIDYSIHLVSRYRMELRESMAKSEALERAVGSTGRGIFFNAATLAVGFGLLVLSSFHAIAVFGALVAGTMATSSFGALTVLPSVLQLLGESQVIGGRVSFGFQKIRPDISKAKES